MQICNKGKPYVVRHYYRALAGETTARRIVQLPKELAGASGYSTQQQALNDGTGIVRIMIGGGFPRQPGAMYGEDMVRSKRSMSKKVHSYNLRYTLIDPAIYMRPEPYYMYLDDGFIWLIPISIHESWLTQFDGGKKDE